MHSRYNTATLDIIPVSSDISESSEKKYINNISRLNEEILIMSSQLKQANETVAVLTNKLNESNSKHALHLQSLHERHEQKIRRNRQDMENLLKEINSKSPNLALEKIILEKNLEIELQKRKFQEKIEEMSKRFESQLEAKENQHKVQLEMLKNQFVGIIGSMKEKFFEQIGKLNEEYDKNVKKIRKNSDLLENCESYSEEETVLDADIDKIREAKRKSEINQENEEFQLMEELSFQANMIIRKPMRESGESDLDMSLRQLINQINLEHEGSITDLLRN